MRIELLNGKDVENRIKVIATAGKLSRTKGTVFDVLDSCEIYEKNLGIVKRIIGMGHKSIMEHDYFVFALSDVTPIIEQTIISYRLTSFTIKSGREVDFRSVGYYVPEFKDKNNKVLKNNKELQEKYKKHMDFLFNEYGYFVDANVKEEDARFVLPYAFNTNIVMGLDARELERMIIAFLYGKPSNIDEIKELGNKLFDIVKEYMPYLVENIENQKPNNIDKFDYLYKFDDINIFDKAKLLNYTPNVDNTIIESAIMYRNQCTSELANEILNELEKKDSNIKEKIINDIKWADEQRELEQVSFQFQIPISLIILKHLTRHRMQSILIPDFVPMWNLSNYKTPPTIKSVDEARFIEDNNINIKVYNEFKDAGVRDEDLVYFYLCGQLVNVYTTMNGRTLEWITRMRSCTKAHWEIRKISNDMIKQVKEIAPLYSTCLGATCDAFGTCPEGKESCGKVNKICAGN